MKILLLFASIGVLSAQYTYNPFTHKLDATGAGSGSGITGIAATGGTATGPTVTFALDFTCASSSITRSSNTITFCFPPFATLPFLTTYTSSTVLTLASNCAAAPLTCQARFGNTTTQVAASGTCTISAGTGTMYAYIHTDGTIKCGSNGLTLVCSAGCAVTTSISAFPATSIPLYTWTATSGTWDASGSADHRAIISTKNNTCTGACTQSESGGTTNFDITSGGITSLNALTGATQTFVVTNTSSAPSVSSSGTAHTFNAQTAVGSLGYTPLSQAANGADVISGAGFRGNIGAQTQFCTYTIAAAASDIPTTPAANSIVCLTGGQSAQAAITISNANVTIWCPLGGTITRNTGGITLLTITAAGFKMEGCNLSTGGTSGGLLVSIGSGGNNAKFLHGKMTGASTNASNAGWFVQTQGSGLLVDDFGCDSTVVDNCMSILASTGDTSDFKVTNTSFSNGGSDKRGLRIGNSSSNTIYNGVISNITCQVTGSCVFFNWAGTPKPRAIVMNNVSHELGGDITTAEPFSIYGCSRCAFSNLAFNDQNHGMTNLPAFAMHDLDFTTMTNYTANFLNAGTQCWLALDSHDFIMNGLTCNGGSLFSTSGRGTVEAGIGAPGSNLNNMTFSNVLITLKTGLAAAIGFHAGNDATGTIDNLVLNNITVTGDGTSGQAGISLTTAGGSIAYPVISSLSLKSVTTGISIGSGVTDASIYGPIGFNSVTTPISDSGTRTNAITHTVAGTGSLTSGTPSTLAVTFSGVNTFSSGKYQCSANNQTNQLNPIKVTYSGSTVTFTGAATTTDTVGYVCSGY